MTRTRSFASGRTFLAVLVAVGLLAGVGMALAQEKAPQTAEEKKAAKDAAEAARKAEAAKARPTPNPEYALLPTVVYTSDNAPKTPSLADLPLAGKVSQYGITWTFDKPARVGQFVNGDYYVVGPVTVTRIDPKPQWGDEVTEPLVKGDCRDDKYPGKTARHGSELNPPSKSGRCGFDSRITGGRYDPELFAHLPIRMAPGDSLVSTISRDNDQLTAWDAQHTDPVLVAAVLTCLAEPVPPDAFRPSYVDTKHSKIFLARNLKRDLLLTLPKPSRAPATLDDYARMFQKPWIDLADFGFAAPKLNLPHYGQNMAQQEGEAVLLLLTDYPAEQKEPLLVGLVQVGIDFHGVARGGFTWHAHGGLYSGRKLPIILAGVLLGYEDMQSPTKKLPNLAFHEDDQTAFGPITYRGKTFQRSWSGSRVIFMGHSPYLIDSMRNHWEKGWGIIDVYPPSEWPKRADGGKVLASEGYRRANTSISWVATALAVRMMHLEKVWNHDAFFAYVDRWMTQDDTPLNEAMRDAGWQDYTKTRPMRNGRHGTVMGARWIREMWDKYRNDLPPSREGSRTPNAEETWK